MTSNDRSEIARPVIYRPAVYKHFHRIAWLAVALTLCVVVFGAFVRLSDAGLSCPDWPTCYGRAAWPKAVDEAASHVASEIRPFETHKAWREQVHRHLAASLGVLVLVLALLAARRRRWGIAQILVAAGLVGAAIPLYMHGEHGAASALAILGEAILLFAALRWSNIDLARAATLTLAVIIFQALLG
ncbi:MAG TPA: COX15/CtaA family protein, partial [Thermomonas sp.]